MKASFPKSERLCKKSDFNTLFSEGNSYTHYPFKVYYLFLPSLNPEIKVAFSVSTKKFKRAVDRNYIKRIFREAYRKNKFVLHEIIHKQSIWLTFVYLSNNRLPYSQFEKEFCIILQKIKELYLSNESNYQTTV